MMKKLEAVISNKSGSILLETLCSFAILTMTITSFSLTVISAETLFQKAAVSSAEWKSLFNNIVEKDFPTTFVDSPTEFNVVLTMGDIDKAGIILADGTPLGSGEIGLSSLPGGTSPSVIMLKEKKFRQYEDKTNIYTIVDK